MLPALVSLARCACLPAAQSSHCPLKCSPAPEQHVSDGIHVASNISRVHYVVRIRSGDAEVALWVSCLTRYLLGAPAPFPCLDLSSILLHSDRRENDLNRNDIIV